MNTRKYPRTMRDAYGPYTSDQLEPMPDKRPLDWQDKLVIGASAVTAAALVFIMVFWGAV